MRKLAFMRALGHGLRTWDSPRYITPGISPSVSYYDRPEVELDTNLHRAAENGVDVLRFRRPPSQPTTTREPRIGAVFSSAPAAAIFQSFANVRWSGELGGMIARPDHPALNANWNPGQQGSKEQQRATIYDPWPAASALYPKVV